MAIFLFMDKKIKIIINPAWVLAVMLFFGLTFSVIKVVYSAAQNPGHAWDTLDDAALPVANGGTGQTSAANAFNALAPSQGGNSGKYLTTNATDTSWSSPSINATTTRVFFNGRSTASLTNDLTCHPYGAVCVAVASNEPSMGATIPFAGTLKNLNVYLSAAQAAGDNCDTYVRKATGGCTGTFNNTALVCSIDDVAQTCTDSTHSVSVAAGDCIQIFYEEAAGSCAGNVSWSFEYQY